MLLLKINIRKTWFSWQCHSVSWLKIMNDGKNSWMQNIWSKICGKWTCMTNWQNLKCRSKFFWNYPEQITGRFLKKDWSSSRIHQGIYISFRELHSRYRWVYFLIKSTMFKFIFKFKVMSNVLVSALSFQTVITMWLDKIQTVTNSF